jgi:hypothetical protein
MVVGIATLVEWRRSPLLESLRWLKAGGRVTLVANLRFKTDVALQVSLRKVELSSSSVAMQNLLTSGVQYLATE